MKANLAGMWQSLFIFLTNWPIESIKIRRFCPCIIPIIRHIVIPMFEKLDAKQLVRIDELCECRKVRKLVKINKGKKIGKIGCEKEVKSC